MSAVEKVKAKLSAYPGVRFSEQVDGIEIHATEASGFNVGLRITPAGFTVYFEGWHEEFASEDEALNCLVFGLSSSCRLGIVRRGNTVTKWIVESLEDGVWKVDSETGLSLQPFWRAARTEYRQNQLISGP